MNLIKVSKLCLVDVRQKFKSLTPSGKYQLSKISSVEYRRFSLWKGFTILVNTLESIIKELISVNSWHEACAWHTYPLTQETDGSIFYGMKIYKKSWRHTCLYQPEDGSHNNTMGGGGGDGRQGGKHRQVGERVTGSGSHGPSVLPSQPPLVMEPT